MFEGRVMPAGVRPAWSLAVRLGWRLALVLLLAILLAGGAVAWRVVETVHELDDSALQSQARPIMARLPAHAATAGTRSSGVVLPEAVVAPFRNSDGDNVFLVYREARLITSSDAAAASLVTPLLPVALHAGFFRIGGFAGHPRGMVGLAIRSGPWLVVVLQGREQTSVLLDSLTGSFLLAALWLLLPIGLAMILMAIWTLQRGLRPLRLVSAAAAMVGPGQPGARLPAEGLPAEVAPLVHAVNQALLRMEQALVTQRHFMAEAAHALRTPLAVLTARLDLLEAPPGGERATGPEQTIAQDGQRGVPALRHDVDRITRLVGQLLRMARLEGLPLDVSQPVALHAVAVEAISALVPLGLQRHVELALHEAPGVAAVRGNHAALVLAVTNLIENAVGHAPAGTTVEVAIAAPARISVLDRGPGVAAPHRTRIFGRFERGPAAAEGGAGLGLAIVAGIAAAHGGAASVSAREGGGAAFILRLPALG